MSIRPSVSRTSLVILWIPVDFIILFLYPPTESCLITAWQCSQQWILPSTIATKVRRVGDNHARLVNSAINLIDRDYYGDHGGNCH